VEAAGLLARFDRWALERAALQLAHWAERAGSLFLSVNVAPGSLEGLPGFLEEVFGRTGLAPERIAVEVVIEPDTDDAAALAGRLTRLKALGCRTALDFSPGHPDTARFLRRVPADMVKLDMAYLAREPDAAGPGRLLDGIDPSEVELLVKRVETEAQYRIARRRVATMGQGYYWTRPLPARLPSED
jgi:EAL domain-containing protein (putative c-di-GMP-specific phosphodiesterase class I)